jgi:hypothetical protein
MVNIDIKDWYENRGNREKIPVIKNLLVPCTNTLFAYPDPRHHLLPHLSPETASFLAPCGWFGSTNQRHC